MGFHCNGGPDVGIAASKHGCKYQIQSDRFEAMWLLVEELCSRLLTYHSGVPDERNDTSFFLTIQVDCTCVQVHDLIAKSVL